MIVTYYNRVDNRNSYVHKEVTEILNDISNNEQLRIATDNFRVKSMSLSPVAVRDLKKMTFGAAIFSGEFSTGTNDDVESLSNLMVLDFDHITDELEISADKFKDKLVDDQYVYAAFISPSGDGVKVLVKHNLTDKKNWASLFNQIYTYFRKKFEIGADLSGKNISRLCYICYDSTAYVNPNSDVFQYTDIVGEIERLERLGYEKTPVTDEVYKKCFYISVYLVENGINIAEDYDDWVKIGFSLAAFGENGRQIFHNISAASVKYNKDECDSQFDVFLSNFDGNRSGIDKFFTIAQTKVEVQTKEDLERDTEYPPLDIYKRLPTTIRSCVAFDTNPKIKFMATISSLGYLSGILPNYKTFHYDRWYHPNLFVWITTQFSGGKNVINRMSNVLTPIEEKIRKQSKAKLASYLKKREEYSIQVESARANGGQYPVFTEIKPKYKTLNISSDTTKAAFVKALDDNDGVGVLKTTEAATLISANSTKFGGFTDVFLKAFEHEVIDKKTKEEDLVEIKNPQLSVILASTENIMTDFFSGSNYENGLFSRFLMFNIRETADKSYSSTNIDQSYAELMNSVIDQHGEQLLLLYTELKNREEILKFQLTDDQKNSYDQFYDKYKNQLKYIFGMDGNLVFRIAVMQKRIAMILSLLRNYEKYFTLTNPEISDDTLVCDDEDFELSQYFIELYMKSIVRVNYLILQHTNKKLNKTQRDDLIKQMYISGKSLKYIASYFSLEEAFILNVLEMGGYKRYATDEVLRRLHYDFNVDKSELAEMFKISLRMVQKITKVAQSTSGNTQTNNTVGGFNLSDFVGSDMDIPSEA